MNTTTVEIGKRGELLAAIHLKKAGYKILCQNFRARRCEIDLVAYKDGCLVFVEVKTRGVSSSEHLFAARAPQLRRLIYAANSFVKTQGFGSHSCRFDLIRIHRDKNSVKVEHLEDAFDSASFLI